jgi:hypothetical protein
MNDKLTIENIFTQAISAAFPKARNLGYDPLKMKTTLHISEGICFVYLSQIEDPNRPIFGGDVTLHYHIEKKELIKTVRGQ